MVEFKKKSSRKKVRLVLISIMTVIFCTTVFIFIRYRTMPLDPVQVMAAIPKGANLAIGRINQTSTKNGKKEWILDAESVHYVNEKKEAQFKDLTITFFLENNEHVYLKADYGTLQTEAHNFEVTGNVVVKNKQYQLTTEKLYYSNITRIIFTKVPVEIIGGPYSVVADSMSFDLNTKISLFEGKVRGIFNEGALF
jgi:LPS export ABC transporter protein LptC